VNSLAVWQQHDAQESAICLGNGRPTSQPPIGLHMLTHRSLNHLGNPLVEDLSPVLALAHGIEIAGGFHEISALPLQRYSTPVWV